jgi:signal peptidase I
MFIKRIIALPKEKLEIKNGNIFINNNLIDIPKIPKSCYYVNGKNFAKEGQILEIPADHYFVLGDNSKASKDSRDWGFLPYNNIKGKAIKIYLPLRRISDIE